MLCIHSAVSNCDVNHIVLTRYDIHTFVIVLAEDAKRKAPYSEVAFVLLWYRQQ
jgi:hypothetical protein